MCLIVPSLCNWKRKASPLNYSVHRESFPYTIKKIPKHDHSESCGWAFNRNLLFCEDAVSEVLLCCVRWWWTPTNRLEDFPWKLNKKTEIPNDEYHVFIFHSVYSVRETAWHQQDVFTYGCSFVLLFTDTLRLHLKLDPFPSLCFGLGFSCLQE